MRDGEYREQSEGGVCRERERGLVLTVAIGET